MGVTTPNIGIYIPAAGETNYDASFASGMVNIDQHDHSGGPNKGVPIATSGIADGSITYSKLNANVADNATGIGTAGSLGANQLSILGLLKNIYQIATTAGFIAKNGSLATARTFQNTDTITWTNPDGSSGNPSASVNNPVLSTTNTVGTSIALPNTWYEVANKSFTAGTWLLFGTVSFETTGVVDPGNQTWDIDLSATTASGTPISGNLYSGDYWGFTGTGVAPINAIGPVTGKVGPYVVTIGSPTTYYLNGRGSTSGATFSNVTAKGTIWGMKVGT